jgi:hypothetical protein
MTKAKSSIKLQMMPKRTKAEQDKVDEQVETDWDKEIAKRRRMDRKAKNEKPKIILEYLDGAKIEWTNGWNDIKSEKKTSYEQGKKDERKDIRDMMERLNSYHNSYRFTNKCSCSYCKLHRKVLKELSKDGSK